MDLSVNEKTISQMLNILQSSGSEALSHYAVWFIAQALVLIILGILMCYFSYKWNHLKDDGSEKIEDFGMFLKGIMFAIGVLFVISNIPDLASPKAAAIHQLIKDIKE